MEQVKPLPELIEKLCFVIEVVSTQEYEDLDDLIREPIVAWLDTQERFDKYYPPESITD